MLSEETNPKHAFAVYLMHWFFVRLNLEYFKLHFGEKKIETLTQFHYGPKSLHVSPKLVQNRVQFSKHHIFYKFFLNTLSYADNRVIINQSQVSAEMTRNIYKGLYTYTHIYITLFGFQSGYQKV